MPKQLIIEPCLINFNDDKGGIAHAAGDIVDVPKATADALARTGRTLYIERKDDPDKNGVHTATPAMLTAAKEMARAQKNEKQAPGKPVDLA